MEHIQRLAELEDIKGAVIDAGAVQFPPIDVYGNVSFIMPFNFSQLCTRDSVNTVSACHCVNIEKVSVINTKRQNMLPCRQLTRQVINMGRGEFYYLSAHPFTVNPQFRSDIYAF